MRIVRKVYLSSNFLSFKSGNRLLRSKLISSIVSFGSLPNLMGKLEITRYNGLIIGDKVEIGKNVKLNATAGISLGSNVKISNGVTMSTVSLINGNKVYNPIVIGRGQIIFKNVEPGSVLPNLLEINKGLSSLHLSPIFIVSTGRSGSKSIAKMLNSHPAVTCYHDAFPHLNTWARNYLYGSMSRNDLINSLITLFNSIDFPNSKFIGLSDHKLTPLIPVLASIFPKAKFIWLIRDASKFVSSSYARGWFDNSEFGYAINKKEFRSKVVTPGHFDASHRVNGFLAGSFPLEEWKSFSAFERNCWYWSYWNDLISDHLSQIDKTNWMKLRLADLNKPNSSLQKFLGISGDIKPLKINKAHYEKVNKEIWTEEMKLIFNRHCKDNMKKWFDG